MRYWTWVKEKEEKRHLNVTETRKNANVITEMWRKHDRSFPTRKHDGKASRPWKTRSPCFRRAETRDGYRQLPVSVEFTKYGNTLFRSAGLWFFFPALLRVVFGLFILIGTARSPFLNLCR